MSYRADNLAVLQEAGDWTAAVPESRRTSLRKVLHWLPVADGGELLSKGKLEVWRDGDTLCFFRRDRNLYTGKDNLYSGELPVQVDSLGFSSGCSVSSGYQAHGTERAYPDRRCDR